jgi:hypothetical protein
VLHRPTAVLLPARHERHKHHLLTAGDAGCDDVKRNERDGDGGAQDCDEWDLVRGNIAAREHVASRAADEEKEEEESAGERDEATSRDALRVVCRRSFRRHHLLLRVRLCGGRVGMGFEFI